MKLLTKLLQISVGIFIAITGVISMPQVAELDKLWFEFIYASSIMLSTVYFIALAFTSESIKFAKDEQEDKNAKT